MQTKRIEIALGLWRTATFGLMVLMSAAGVLGFLGSYINIGDDGQIIWAYARYPKNLMLTAIPNLGALVALFILRNMDNFLSLSGYRQIAESDKK